MNVASSMLYNYLQAIHKFSDILQVERDFIYIKQSEKD